MCGYVLVHPSFVIWIDSLFSITELIFSLYCLLQTLFIWNFIEFIWLKSKFCNNKDKMRYTNFLMEINIYLYHNQSVIFKKEMFTLSNISCFSLYHLFLFILLVRMYASFNVNIFWSDPNHIVILATEHCPIWNNSCIYKTLK